MSLLDDLRELSRQAELKQQETKRLVDEATAKKNQEIRSRVGETIDFLFNRIEKELKDAANSNMKSLATYVAFVPSNSRELQAEYLAMDPLMIKLQAVGLTVRKTYRHQDYSSDEGCAVQSDGSWHGFSISWS